MTILTARDDLSPSALARLESLEADGLLRRHRLPLSPGTDRGAAPQGAGR